MTVLSIMVMVQSLIICHVVADNQQAYMTNELHKKFLLQLDFCSYLLEATKSHNKWELKLT